MGKITVTRGRKVGCENYGSVESSVTLEMDLEFDQPEERISEWAKHLQSMAEKLVEEDLQAPPARYQGDTRVHGSPPGPAPETYPAITDPAIPDLGSAPSQARAPYASNVRPASPQRTLPLGPPQQPAPVQQPRAPYVQRQYDDFKAPKLARGFYPWMMKMSDHFSWPGMKDRVAAIAKENNMPWNSREWDDATANWMGNAIIQDIRNLPSYQGEFDKP